MASSLEVVPGRSEASSGSDLAVEGVVVTFGGVRAVDNVSLSFRGGEITGLIGPNGAGKTSLLQVIAGSIAPASGQVLLGGKSISGLAPSGRARMGLIRTFQTARVFSRLSVLENILVGVPDQIGDSVTAALVRRGEWKRQEAAARARANALLRDFNMEGHSSTRASELSGGQRRIVEYLRSLMAGPRVLLLDEPTVGLAPWVTERLVRDFRRLRDEGVCILIVEHEMELIRNLCDVVHVMANGKVIASGDFESVAANSEVQEAYLGNEL